MSDDVQNLLSQLQSLTPEQRAQLLAQIVRQQSGGVNLGVANTIGQTGDIVAGDQTRGAVDNHGRIDGVAVGVNLGRIVYGRDPEEDERRRLAWYLDSLANKLYRLPLRGIEQRLDQGEGMALPHVYVMLAAHARFRIVAQGTREDIRKYFTDDKLNDLHDEYDPNMVLPDSAITYKGISAILLDRSEAEEAWVPLDAMPNKRVKSINHEKLSVMRSQLLTELVYVHGQIVLLGDPGSGKSTFLRHLAWMLAHRGLDQSVQSTSLFGWSDDARSLPLLLPLRALATQIAIHGPQPAVVSVALSAELSTSYAVRQADALIEQALHSGAALLLLDGLDEVPLESSRGHADRITTLRVVREFVQLYPRARAVLTCRVRAFDDALRAELGWPVETIAPFTLGQIRHFIPAWYGELVAVGQIEPAQAERIGQKLLDAIADPVRPRLREMAATPLLLTMMALVLYNQGELPRDRPQLYERILELLLGQWDKVHAGKSLPEAIGKPEWESRDFLPLLDRLCYEAHREATSADGRGRLSRGSLYTALIDFFRQARMPQPGEAALCCLDYFEQRSGLLAADGRDTYVLAHLTLQEHGAGRYMAVQSDDPIGLIMQHRADDRWREPILLGAGLLRPADLNTLLADLIDPEERECAKLPDRRQKDLILAAEIGADRDWNLLRTRSAIKVDRLQRDLKRGLVELLSDRSQPLPVAERVRAGFLLGDLGDPRVPVTIDEWHEALARAQAGDTTGYFCRVDAGAYTIGSADDPDAGDDEQPQHLVMFDTPFWIARYPITNAQWRAWVEQAGEQARAFADDTDPNRPNQPVVAVTWHLCNEFCAWLSEQLGVTVRLPTEPEWESAARGGDAWRYPWGDNWQDDRAATEEDQEARGARYTVPVGCYPAGAAPCGALDMAGNVWEWTASVWQSYPGATKLFTEDRYRVVRGGSWHSIRKRVSCGARNGNYPFNDIYSSGFRVVVAPHFAR